MAGPDDGMLGPLKKSGLSQKYYACNITKYYKQGALIKFTTEILYNQPFLCCNFIKIYYHCIKTPIFHVALHFQKHC